MTSATVNQVVSTQPAESLDLALASVAVRLVDRVKQSIREVGDEQGLSVSQLDVVRRLHAYGPTPMSRLAEKMNCEASNLTGLVDRLESRGLVTRLADPADRRVKVLALTHAGEELSQDTWIAVAEHCPLNRLSPERRRLAFELLDEALQGLSPSEEGS